MDKEIRTTRRFANFIYFVQMIIVANPNNYFLVTSFFILKQFILQYARINKNEGTQTIFLIFESKSFDNILLAKH